MHSYTLWTGGRVLPIDAGGLVSTALQQAGVSFSLPCGGRQTCGKCAIWISGPVEPPSEKELRALKALRDAYLPKEGYALRLACFCRVHGDCDVQFPVADASILTRGDGDLPPYDGSRPDAVGFAIDVGTTTVALHLYDLPGGTLLATDAILNPQATYGADVLSRIVQSNVHGHMTLSMALRNCLSDRMLAMLAETAVSAERVERIVVTGNTTMLHFLAGLDPAGIGVSPFTPQSLFGKELPAQAIFPKMPGGARLYLPRCISAYVGADITCGIVSGQVAGGGIPRLLVDVGTNGEMALYTGRDLLCCATAAGPAFEGAHISMGMAASEGAISHVSVRDGMLTWTTIGNVPARGICGTGLISAIVALLQTGVLDETGALQEDAPDPYPLGDSGVSLSSRDIREVQLAKAAIAAGIDTLLHTAGLRPEDAELLLAGGFGTTIDPQSAADIGLIPRAFLGRTSAKGNLALSGAAMMLFSREARTQGELLAQGTQEVSLATNPYFMDQYMNQMMFPEGE